MKSPSRFLGFLLTIIYLCTNVVFAGLPERTMWDERRQALEVSQKPLTFPVAPRESGLPSLVSLLSAHGTISAITPAEKTSAPVVIYIQDVHGRAEAQKNIAAMVLNVLEKNPQAAVGLEGAAGPISMDRFRGASVNINREVGSFFLNTGLITGAEEAGFAASAPPHFFGLEDKELYLKNVAAVRSAKTNQKEILAALEKEHRALAAEKVRVYSQELLSLDQAKQSYSEGQITVGDYLAALTARGVPATSFPNVALFQKTWALEKNLDFDRAERERNQVLTRLAGRLAASELNGLVRESMAVRAGATPYPVYYRRLKEAIAKAGVSLAEAPEFDRYVNYVLQSDAIKPAKFLSELSAYEKTVWMNECRTDEQRRLYQASIKSQLTEKLVRLTLSPQEWKEAKAVIRPGQIQSFQDFYKAAEARNSALARNFIANTKQSDISVLVAGGFHSEALTSILANGERTVITVTPKLSQASLNQHDDYLDVFTREKTPLEQLFASPKISIVETLATAPIPGVGVSNVLEYEVGETISAMQSAEKKGEARENYPGHFVVACEKGAHQLSDLAGKATAVLVGSSDHYDVGFYADQSPLQALRAQRDARIVTVVPAPAKFKEGGHHVFADATETVIIENVNDDSMVLELIRNNPNYPAEVNHAVETAVNALLKHAHKQNLGRFVRLMEGGYTLGGYHVPSVTDADLNKLVAGHRLNPAFLYSLEKLRIQKGWNLQEKVRVTVITRTSQKIVQAFFRRPDVVRTLNNLGIELGLIGTVVRSTGEGIDDFEVETSLVIKDNRFVFPGTFNEIYFGDDKEAKEFGSYGENFINVQYPAYPEGHPWARAGAPIQSRLRILTAPIREWWLPLPMLVPVLGTAALIHYFQPHWLWMQIFVLFAGLVGYILALERYEKTHKRTHNPKGWVDVQTLLFFFGFGASSAGFILYIFFDDLRLAFAGAFVLYQVLHFLRNLHAVINPTIAPLSGSSPSSSEINLLEALMEKESPFQAVKDLNWLMKQTREKSEQYRELRALRDKISDRGVQILRESVTALLGRIRDIDNRLRSVMLRSNPRYQHRKTVDSFSKYYLKPLIEKAREKRSRTFTGIAGAAAAGKTTFVNSVISQLKEWFSPQGDNVRFFSFDDFLMEKADRPSQKDDPYVKFNVRRYLQFVKDIFENRFATKPMYDQTSKGQIKFGLDDQGHFAIFNGDRAIHFSFSGDRFSYEEKGNVAEPMHQENISSSKEFDCGENKMSFRRLEDGRLEITIRQSTYLLRETSASTYEITTVGLDDTTVLKKGRENRKEVLEVWQSVQPGKHEHVVIEGILAFEAAVAGQLRVGQQAENYFDVTASILVDDMVRARRDFLRSQSRKQTEDQIQQTIDARAERQYGEDQLVYRLDEEAEKQYGVTTQGESATHFQVDNHTLPELLTLALRNSVFIPLDDLREFIPEIPAKLKGLENVASIALQTSIQDDYRRKEAAGKHWREPQRFPNEVDYEQRNIFDRYWKNIQRLVTLAIGHLLMKFALPGDGQYAEINKKWEPYFKLLLTKLHGLFIGTEFLSFPQNQENKEYIFEAMRRPEGWEKLPKDEEWPRDPHRFKLRDVQIMEQIPFMEGILNGLAVEHKRLVDRGDLQSAAAIEQQGHEKIRNFFKTVLTMMERGIVDRVPDMAQRYGEKRHEGQLVVMGLAPGTYRLAEQDPNHFYADGRTTFVNLGKLWDDLEAYSELQKQNPHEWVMDRKADINFAKHKRDYPSMGRLVGYQKQFLVNIIDGEDQLERIPEIFRGFFIDQVLENIPGTEAEFNRIFNRDKSPHPISGVSSAFVEDARTAYLEEAITDVYRKQKMAYFNETFLPMEASRRKGNPRLAWSVYYLEYLESRGIRDGLYYLTRTFVDLLSRDPSWLAGLSQIAVVDNVCEAVQSALTKAHHGNSPFIPEWHWRAFRSFVDDAVQLPEMWDKQIPHPTERSSEMASISPAKKNNISYRDGFAVHSNTDPKTGNTFKVTPALGANTISLVIDGHEILFDPGLSLLGKDGKPRQLGMPMLFPIISRLGGNKKRKADGSVLDASNFKTPRRDGNGVLLHAMALGLPFEVESEGPGFMTLTLDSRTLKEDVRAEFEALTEVPVFLRVTYSLSGRKFSTETVITNLGDVDTEVALGHHINLNGRNDGISFQTSASQRWNAPEGNIPSRERPLIDVDGKFDFRNGLLLGKDVDYDVTLTGFSPVDGKIISTLRDPKAGIQIQVIQDAKAYPNLNFWRQTTGDNQGVCAAQPWSAPSDAHNLQADGIHSHLLALKRGVPVKSEVTIEVTPLPKTNDGPVIESNLPEEEVAELVKAADGFMKKAKDVHDDNVIAQWKKGLKRDDAFVAATVRAVQQAFVEALQARYPGHYLLAKGTLYPPEEKINKQNEKSDYVWIFNPIDNEEMFLAGGNLYSISMVLYYRGRPVLALIWTPAYGFLETSQNDPNVYLDARPVKELESHAAIQHFWAIVSGQSVNAGRLRQFIEAMTIKSDFMGARIRSTAVRAAQILFGELDFAAFFEKDRGTQLDDIAAIAYILQKRGGTFNVFSDGRSRPVLDVIAEDIVSPETRSKPYRYMAGSPAAMTIMAPAIQQLTGTMGEETGLSHEQLSDFREVIYGSIKNKRALTQSELYDAIPFIDASASFRKALDIVLSKGQKVSEEELDDIVKTCHLNKAEEAALTYLLYPGQGSSEWDDEFPGTEGLSQTVEIRGPNGEVFNWKVSEESAVDIGALSKENPSLMEGTERLREMMGQSDQPTVLTHKGYISWAIDHAYDPDLKLTDISRDLLFRRINDNLSEFFSSKRMAMDLQMYWVLRLLVLNRNAQRAGFTEEKLRAPIHKLLKAIIHGLQSSFETGMLDMHPMDRYEPSLLEIPKGQPDLRQGIADLFKNWRLWAKEGGEIILHWGQDNYVDKKADAPEPTPEETEKLNQQLLELRNILQPKPQGSAKARAWHHPVDYVLDLAEQADVTYLETWMMEPPVSMQGYARFPNAWLFQLDWLDRMGQSGVKRWGIVPAEKYFGSLHAWLLEKKDNRSLLELMQELQQYLEQRRATIPISLFLVLPQGELPPGVLRELRFWEQMFELKRTHGAIVTLFQDSSRAVVKQREAFAKWLKLNDQKRLVLGLDKTMDEQKPNISNFVHLNQRPPRVKYEEDKFIFRQALEYVINWLANDFGWGDHKSVVVDYHHNDPLNNHVGFEVEKRYDALIFTSARREFDDPEEPLYNDFDDQWASKKPPVLLGADARPYWQEHWDFFVASFPMAVFLVSLVFVREPAAVVNNFIVALGLTWLAHALAEDRFILPHFKRAFRFHRGLFLKPSLVTSGLRVDKLAYRSYNRYLKLRFVLYAYFPLILLGVAVFYDLPLVAILSSYAVGIIAMRLLHGIDRKHLPWSREIHDITAEVDAQAVYQLEVPQQRDLLFEGYNFRKTQNMLERRLEAQLTHTQLRAERANGAYLAGRAGTALPETGGRIRWVLGFLTQRVLNTSTVLMPIIRRINDERATRVQVFHVDSLFSENPDPQLLDKMKSSAVKEKNIQRVYVARGMSREKLAHRLNDFKIFDADPNAILVVVPQAVLIRPLSIKLAAEKDMRWHSGSNVWLDIFTNTPDQFDPDDDYIRAIINAPCAAGWVPVSLQLYLAHVVAGNA